SPAVCASREKGSVEQETWHTWCTWRTWHHCPPFTRRFGPVTSEQRPQSADYGLWHRLRRLFLAFIRVGIFGFGGGPSMIPLVRIEAVKTNSWLSDEEFMELYAVASSLPGPISTNLAGYFGFRVAGPLGS